MRPDYRGAAPRHFSGIVRILAVVLLFLFARVGVAADTAASPLRFTLDTLPEKSLWAGLLINNARVGYAHVSVQPAATGLYAIRSETVIALRMLEFEKTIVMRTRDAVQPDLSLVDFEAEILMDGNRLAMSGRVEGARLFLKLENAGVATDREIALSGPILPGSAVGLLPLIRGVEPGRSYSYSVFNPESMQVADVEQAVESGAEHPGAAFAIRSRQEGQDGVMWLDARGRVLGETAMGGALRAIPESEGNARDYLRSARSTGQDVMVDLSLVKADRDVALPRNVGKMRIALEGIGLELPSGTGQRCQRTRTTWDCELDSSLRGAQSGDAGAWLRPSFTVPSTDASIVRLAGEIAGAAGSADARVQAILRWLGDNIRKQAADAFTALDVLATRRAECQGHTYLYAALARASGIPTRVANGLVYSEEHRGFLYHTWAESLIGGQWRAVDPTFGQPVADATHIKVLEGEDYGDIAPMVDLVGRVKARIASYEYRR